MVLLTCNVKILSDDIVFSNQPDCLLIITPAEKVASTLTTNIPELSGKCSGVNGGWSFWIVRFYTSCFAQCLFVRRRVLTLLKCFKRLSADLKTRLMLDISSRQGNSKTASLGIWVPSITKDCNFKAVNAEHNREDFIRDAFINDLLAKSLRKRLLESSIA